jgi:hypothetical protein
MSVSLADLSAALILIVAIAKGVWDFVVLPRWKKGYLEDKARDELTAAIEVISRRHSVANKLAFGAITVLSALTIAAGLKERKVTWDDHQALDARVATLESRILAPPDQNEEIIDEPHEIQPGSPGQENRRPSLAGRAERSDDLPEDPEAARRP